MAAAVDRGQRSQQGPSMLIGADGRPLLGRGSAHLEGFGGEHKDCEARAAQPACRHIVCQDRLFP